MTEWFDLASQEADISIKKSEKVIKDPVGNLITLLNGHFFNMMKLLNEKKSQQ